jgi:hypothetical protein
MRVLSPPVRGAHSRWVSVAGYPRVRVDGAGKGVVSRAGGALLTATIRASGLDAALPAVLAPWRKPLAIHDPAKVLLDLAVALGHGAGATHDVVNYLHARRMSYSIGFTLPDDTADLLKLIPDRAWTPAYDAQGKVRTGAWVAELTGLLDLTEHKWPKDMRVIAARNAPTRAPSYGSPTWTGTGSPRSPPTPPPAGPAPSYQTWNYATAAGPAPRTASFRCAKDSGLTNLPLHDLDQNRIWCAIVALACEITAWMQMLALTDHPARRWEPKRLRLRLFSIAGHLATTARVTTLHLAGYAPWAGLVQQALDRLHALAAMPAPVG